MVKTVKIRGKRYRLRFADLPPELDGDCDNPATKGKAIRINRKLRGLEQLDTIIHELLHAAFWDLDEQAILEAGTDVAKALWRLGYRINPPTKD